MAEPNKAKPIFTIGCGGAFPLSLPVTDGGTGWYCNAGVLFSHMDEALSLSVLGGYTDTKLNGKLFKDAYGDGTQAPYRRKLIGLEWGMSNRSRFQTDSSAHPWFALRSGSSSTIEYGWGDMAAPDMNVSGKDYAGASDKWKMLALGKKNSLAFEFWPHPDFQITPEIGLKMMAMHPLVSREDMQEYAFSPQGIELFIGLNIAYGSPSHVLAKGRKLSSLGIAQYFGQELHGFFYDLILFNNFSGPQIRAQNALDEVFNGGGGDAGSSSSWMIPSLKAVSTTMGATGRIKPVNFYLRAPGAWKYGGLALEAVKGIGYTAAGLGGDPEDGELLSPGITALGNVATMGISELIDKEEYLFLFPFLLGGAEMILGGLIQEGSPYRDGLVSGGTSLAAGWAMNPEQGTKDFIDETIYHYSPATYVYAKGTSGLAGSYSVRNYFKNSPMFVGFQLTSPALMVANLGNLGLNYAKPAEDGNGFKDAGVANTMASTIGIGHTFDLSKRVYLKTDIGASLITQYDAISTKPGGAITGRLDLGIKLSEKISINLGADVTGYLTFGDRGFMATPNIGLMWND